MRPLCWDTSCKMLTLFRPQFMKYELQAYTNININKGKGKGHPRTGHEGPEGE